MPTELGLIEELCRYLKKFKLQEQGGRHGDEKLKPKEGQRERRPEE